MGVPRDRVLLGAAPLLATLAAYQPAWQGDMLWDDDAHLTSPALQSWEGLRRIWFEIGATQQYYPVTHSAFWVQHTLWGDRTPGYHLLNIGLHATCAWLFGLILVRLKVPGAWVAAFIFALHPVHVESVAWVTELKNTLSGALGLGAMIVLLGSGDLAMERARDRGIGTPPDRQIGRYTLALSLFALALLSKTTVAVLPAAVLVLVWGQRGAVEWRRDGGPIVPLSTVDDRRARVVAVGLPGRRRGGRGGVLEDREGSSFDPSTCSGSFRAGSRDDRLRTSGARADGRAVAVWRPVVSRARLRRPLPVQILVLGGAVPV